MKPIPTHPDLPEPTNTFGRPVAKSQWYECPHCKQPSPLSREWVSLTDEERHSIREWQRIQEELGTVWSPMMLYLYEAIEAKLKEKNT